MLIYKASVMRCSALKLKVIFAIIFVFFSQSLFSKNILVQGLNPKPNYQHKNISNDFKFLHDDEIEWFPLWTKKKAVAWASRTPVLIDASMNVNEEGMTSGVLRIHAAKGLYANVDLPRQIDVYANYGNDKYELLSTKYFNVSEFTDKRAHWLELSLIKSSKNILIVVHSSNRYMVLDEISFDKKMVDVVDVSRDSTLTKEQLIKDSSSRLKANITLGNADEKRYERIKKEGVVTYSWIQDPWINIENSIINTDKSDIIIQGFNREIESFCIAIHNSSVKEKRYKFNIDGSLNDSSLNINELLPVISANGSKVYDVIKPVINNFLIKSNQTKYIWFNIDLSKVKTGSGVYFIDLMEHNNINLKRYELKVQNINVVRPLIDTLSVNNWAYYDDLPIWKDKKYTLNKLIEYGTNVFVVHPQNIPGLKLNNKIELKKHKAFHKNVQIFKGNGKILLFLGWSSKNNPFGFKLHKSKALAKAKEFEDWLNFITSLMRENGLGYADWALYPIDEPRGAEHIFLREIALFIKKVNSNINIYADPASSHSMATDVSHLKLLNGLVDIWQPHLQLARSSAVDYFNDLNQPWWIYHNPSIPAKASSPLNDYRKTSWWAWMLGAQGVGFWSFSDTAGSSAWDDFDGYRPDWSVVYESDDGIYSSRRLEAFRDGLEDYQLLALSKYKINKNEMIKNWGFSDFQLKRNLILSDLLLTQKVSSED